MKKYEQRYCLNKPHAVKSYVLLLVTKLCTEIWYKILIIWIEIIKKILLSIKTGKITTFALT